ncbi:MAG: 2-dehydro-3-deoxygluconokinase [Bacillota bacterium]|nr:MAG: 2-dehydro-3-deoxygluconokinase [Bacillota bacterium]
MAKIITMGEIMLRLSSAGHKRFVQSESFDVCYGGGEANVAVSLANYGHDAYFVSKVPAHEIGQCAVNSLRKYGVNTEYIARGGERLGIYFLETGASVRASKVIYDRARSAIAEADVSDFDFDEIFDGADWFHFTGITPALGKKAQIVLESALKAAKARGVTVSVDLNYRKKLWTPEEARACMTKLMRYVDVCVGNEEDAEKCLGFSPAGTNVKAGALDISGYEDIFCKMKEKFGFRYIAASLRESFSASRNGWSALAYDGKEFYRSRRYDVEIVDRVGAGDSFAAGWIHGLIAYGDFKKALEFAAAASALKHTVEGDVNLTSAAEVETLMLGDGSGRVQR